MATVTLKGISTVTKDTTANWNKYPKFVPKNGELIVYSDVDFLVNQNGVEIPIPGIKVGDGNAYLSDLPFVGTKGAAGYYDVTEVLNALEAHEKNQDIHVTPEEKQKWNDKLNYEVQGETLIFTTD